MSTTVVQTQSQPYPIGQHQSAVIQLQTVHTNTTTHTTTSTSIPRNTEYNQKAAITTGVLQVGFYQQVLCNSM